MVNISLYIGSKSFLCPVFINVPSWFDFCLKYGCVLTVYCIVLVCLKCIPEIYKTVFFFLKKNLNTIRDGYFQWLKVREKHFAHSSPVKILGLFEFLLTLLIVSIQLVFDMLVLQKHNTEMTVAAGEALYTLVCLHQVGELCSTGSASPYPEQMQGNLDSW